LITFHVILPGLVDRMTGQSVTSCVPNPPD
jgi:hypothetical protein